MRREWDRSAKFTDAWMRVRGWAAIDLGVRSERGGGIELDAMVSDGTGQGQD